MVNYTNSKVYKIWSNKGDMIYIGSTTKKYLSQRMNSHRTDYARFKNGKSNFISSFKLFEEYGLENCFIELIEAKEFRSKDELHQLEGTYIRELGCVNRCIAGRTKKEYRAENITEILNKEKEFRDKNKEKIAIEMDQYYKKNKDKILERMQQKYTCDCGSTLRISDKSRHLKSIKHCQYIESHTDTSL